MHYMWWNILHPSSPLQHLWISSLYFFPWRETAVGVCGSIRQVRKSLSRKCEKNKGTFHIHTFRTSDIFFFSPLEKASSVWPMTSGADASGPSAEMHHTWGRQEAAAECHCRVSAVVCETGFRVCWRPVLIKLNSPSVWRNTTFAESPFKKNWAAFKWGDFKASPRQTVKPVDVVPCIRRSIRRQEKWLFERRLIHPSNDWPFEAVYVSQKQT